MDIFTCGRAQRFLRNYLLTIQKKVNNPITGSYIEQVQQYKYLGSIINDINSIEEEVKERIALGIKAFYANQKFFKTGKSLRARN